MTPGADAGKLVLRRRIAAPRAEVFREWTDPEGMRSWMCPGDIVSADVRMDLRVGGRLSIVMSSPTAAYEHRGEFTVVEPPSRLAFTWIADATGMRPTLVTVEIVEIGETECELVLTHEKLAKDDVRERYQGGWAQIVTRLESHIRARS